MNYDDFQIGYQGTFTRTITEELNTRFAELSMDKNPVHCDEERMKKTFLGKRVTSGLLTITTIAVALVNMFTSDSTLPLAIEKKIRFIAPVYMGDTITATVTVKERIPEKKRILCDCVVKNQDGEVVMKEDFLITIING